MIGNGGKRPRSIVIEPCVLAERDHRREQRRYAHVFHVPGTICVANAYFDLPSEHQRGVVYHEMGHLLIGRRPHSEDEADRTAEAALGVRIKYRDGPHGRQLQWAEVR